MLRGFQAPKFISGDSTRLTQTPPSFRIPLCI